MKRILISVILCIAVSVTAQNRILVLQREETAGQVTNADTTDDDYRYALDYHITPAPPLVISLLNSPNDPVKAANKTVQNFQLWHLKYSSGINASRDFLDVSFFWIVPDPYPEDYHYRQDSVRRESMKKTIFSNRTLRETIYNWLIPFYKIAFAMMSVPEQQDYLTMFREAREYAQTLDVAKERVDAEGPEPWTFLESRGDHRAFVYRRISRNEIPREECIEWLDRIISDFSAAATPSPRPEDQYVLLDDLDNGYFTAAHYRQANSYGRNYVIMRRTNGVFNLLPGVEFYSGDYNASSFITGSIATRPTGEYGSVFYCDSAGWTFTPTMYYGNPDDYIVKGNGASARFILVDGFDYDHKEKTDQSRSLCALVDADSGTVIFDSIYIESNAEYTDWEVNYSYPARTEDYTIFMVAQTGLYGVMNKNGFVVVPPKYRTITKTEDPHVVKLNGRKKMNLDRAKK